MGERWTRANNAAVDYGNRFMRPHSITSERVDPDSGQLQRAIVYKDKPAIREDGAPVPIPKTWSYAGRTGKVLAGLLVVGSIASVARGNNEPVEQLAGAPAGLVSDGLSTGIETGSVALSSGFDAAGDAAEESGAGDLLDGVRERAADFITPGEEASPDTTTTITPTTTTEAPTTTTTTTQPTTTTEALPTITSAPGPELEPIVLGNLLCREIIPTLLVEDNGSISGTVMSVNPEMTAATQSERYLIIDSVIADPANAHIAANPDSVYPTTDINNVPAGCAPR